VSEVPAAVGKKVLSCEDHVGKKVGVDHAGKKKGNPLRGDRRIKTSRPRPKLSDNVEREGYASAKKGRPAPYSTEETGAKGALRGNLDPHGYRDPKKKMTNHPMEGDFLEQ